VPLTIPSLSLSLLPPLCELPSTHSAALRHWHSSSADDGDDLYPPLCLMHSSSLLAVTSHRLSRPGSGEEAGKITFQVIELGQNPQCQGKVSEYVVWVPSGIGRYLTTVLIESPSECVCVYSSLPLYTTNKLY